MNNFSFSAELERELRDAKTSNEIEMIFERSKVKMDVIKEGILMDIMGNPKLFDVPNDERKYPTIKEMFLLGAWKYADRMQHLTDLERRYG